MKLLLFWCVLSAMAQQPAVDSTPNPVAGNPQSIQNGRKTFVGSCGGCHGPTGEGGRGPTLRDGKIIRRSTDALLFRSIRLGIAGTEMPPSALPDDQIWEMVAFIRALGAPAATTIVAGDAAKGAEVYRSNGCSNCHSVAGQGGVLGPDLTNLGATRSYEYIRESILKPGERITAGYQKAIAKTKDGRVIEGICRDYTNYDVQITDKQGKLYLLKTTDLEDLKVSVASWMPADYSSRIGKEDLMNLLAYLSKLSMRPVDAAPKKRGGAR